jgi:hypothetical protein
MNPNVQNGKEGNIMAKYIALHTLKKSPEETMKVFAEAAPQMARSMAAGETSAKCIKTWNPIPHGRTDYIFCLWEADKPEDIEASLGDFLNYVTIDNIQVDEIDWEEAAKAGS